MVLASETGVLEARRGELDKLRQVDHHIFNGETLDATWPAAEGTAGLERAMDRLCREASECLDAGATS